MQEGQGDTEPWVSIWIPFGFVSGFFFFFFPISPDKIHILTLDAFLHTTSFINQNIQFLCLQCWGAEKFQLSISFLSFSSQKIRK